MDGKMLEQLGADLGALAWSVLLSLGWCVLAFAGGLIAAGPLGKRWRARRAGARKQVWPGATLHRVDRAERPALVQPGGVVGGVYLPAPGVPLPRDRSVPPVLLDVATTRTGVVRPLRRPAVGGAR